MSNFAFGSILFFGAVCFYGLACRWATQGAWGWMLFNCAAGSIFLALAFKVWIEPEPPEDEG